MTVLRRWLASGALTLTALQLALLFTVPVSACCSQSAAGKAALSAASEDAPDCCPPGAHPKGECPLHRNKPTHCKLTCGHTSGPEFLLGAIGVLPAPSVVIVPFAASAVPVSASVILPLRSSVPDAPPPKRH